MTDHNNDIKDWTTEEIDNLVLMWRDNAEMVVDIIEKYPLNKENYTYFITELIHQLGKW